MHACTGKQTVLGDVAGNVGDGEAEARRVGAREKVSVKVDRVHPHERDAAVEHEPARTRQADARRRQVGQDDVAHVGRRINSCEWLWLSATNAAQRHSQRGRCPQQQQHKRPKKLLGRHAGKRTGQGETYGRTTVANVLVS